MNSSIVTNAPICLPNDAEAHCDEASAPAVRLKERVTAANLPGVREVRVLSDGRHAPRAFWILDTHDLRRDQKIVDLMLDELEAFDYDLVPHQRAAWVPKEATHAYP